MSYEVEVKNLGKIVEGRFKVSDLTVITGPNGTGKSFFTKFMYSILTTAENFSLWVRTRQLLSGLDNRFSTILEFPEESRTTDIKKLLELQDMVNVIFENYYTVENKPKNFDDELQLIGLIHPESVKVTEFAETFLSNEIKVGSEAYHSLSHIEQLELTTRAAICSSLSGLTLYTSTSHRQAAYDYFLGGGISKELKDNFQVSNLNEIIRHNAEGIYFTLDNSLSLKVDRDGEVMVNTDGCSDLISLLRSKPNSVFFESPLYWRLRDVLNDAKINSDEGFLSGVPKYFFDLDRALRQKSRDGNQFDILHEKISNKIGGEFEVKGTDLIFKLNDGQEISKNLVSFGMTNFGMLNALIKNNVIRSGSFVFIDEPETNLHPDWQVEIIKTLVELSNAGVKIVLNTHSIEILKFIETTFSSFDSLDERLAINFLDIDGRTIDFEDENPLNNIKESREILSSTYFDLYMRG
ncbi:AAA family ATPase [Vibrio sp. 779(2023)]|uniref:AAA family ATPase n=1 Tax=Vibrio sp. 779(2023) TaxID=3074712 RepID=UPI0029667726|nr:AAA family ATPase [Vibrio sp. 779(2023)]MDW3153973.1 AAA family ATPase [Vibrio sp. 779(2023)]